MTGERGRCLLFSGPTASLRPKSPNYPNHGPLKLKPVGGDRRE